MRESFQKIRSCPYLSCQIAVLVCDVVSLEGLEVSSLLNRNDKTERHYEKSIRQIHNHRRRLFAIDRGVRAGNLTR